MTQDQRLYVSSLQFQVFLWIPCKILILRRFIFLQQLFNNFFPSNLRNKVFNIIIKPNIYLKFIDEILLTNSTNWINTIQRTFQNNSVFNFIQYLSINNKTLFLGILIDMSNLSKFTYAIWMGHPMRLIYRGDFECHSYGHVLHVFPDESNS